VKPNYCGQRYFDMNPNAGGSIRFFGVGLLAVAAFAAAGLLWKRRQDVLEYYLPEASDDRLEALRAAGF
jgi:hypothetical protein